MGGNLLQRTRCPYFRDVGYDACNKRTPGSGCSAIGGENRWHAVLGTSEACIAAHPSDLAVALVALDAAVDVRGGGRQRVVPLVEFHRLPGTTPHIETVLEPGEVITAIVVRANPMARRSHYLKVRDRASFEFTVVSAAVALDMDASRRSHARRKFFVLADIAAKARGKLTVVAPLALEAVRRMDAIFAIEREINGRIRGYEAPMVHSGCNG